MKLIAQHPNGLTVKMSKHTIVFTTPMMRARTEYLENNRRITIVVCDFFDGYLGVGHSLMDARNQARKAIARMLRSISDAGTLNTYLKDKGYNLSLWGSLQSDPCKNKKILVK